MGEGSSGRRCQRARAAAARARVAPVDQHRPGRRRLDEPEHEREQRGLARAGAPDDADLAAAMMGINAVKGVEIGAGFGAAIMSGEENADEMRMKGKAVEFFSNNAGGILGGISTGQDVVVRFAVKPTSSILTPRRTVSRQGKNVEIATKGRHDPCVGIRGVPVGEAMIACVLADHVLRHRGQVGD